MSYKGLLLLLVNSSTPTVALSSCQFRSFHQSYNSGKLDGMPESMYCEKSIVKNRDLCYFEEMKEVKRLCVCLFVCVCDD
jgi:hypothetical protein